jgi:hypothetical protein
MADSGGLSANNAAAALDDDDANTAPFPDTVRIYRHAPLSFPFLSFPL